MAHRGSGKSAWGRLLIPAVMVVSVGLAYLAYLLTQVNAAEVRVDFLLGQVVLASWQALGLAFLAGAGLVAVYSLYQTARGGLLRRRYRKQLAGLETEVHRLRNLPLAPEGSVPGVEDIDLEHELAR